MLSSSLWEEIIIKKKDLVGFKNLLGLNEKGTTNKWQKQP